MRRISLRPDLLQHVLVLQGVMAPVAQAAGPPVHDGVQGVEGTGLSDYIGAAVSVLASEFCATQGSIAIVSECMCKQWPVVRGSWPQPRKLVHLYMMVVRGWKARGERLQLQWCLSIHRLAPEFCASNGSLVK